MPQTSQIFKNKQQNILQLWMEKQLADAGLREDLMSNEDLRVQSEELIQALVNAINDENLSNSTAHDFEPVIEILEGISVSRASQGYSPRETGIFVLSLKEALLDILHSELQNDPVRLYTETLKVNRLIDSFSITTFETFIKSREEVILRQTDEITEISTPVIRVWDGILALPIIGTLDSSRTQVVMESLLEEIVITGSSLAILDISGVPAVDSLVAQHLIKAVSATRLMGAECIISGIRPEIAQTIVHLGIDLSGIITKATLAHALKYAFSTLRLEVKRKSSPAAEKLN